MNWVPESMAEVLVGNLTEGVFGDSRTNVSTIIYLACLRRAGLSFDANPLLRATR